MTAQEEYNNLPCFCSKCKWTGKVKDLVNDSFGKICPNCHDGPCEFFPAKRKEPDMTEDNKVFKYADLIINQEDPERIAFVEKFLLFLLEQNLEDSLRKEIKEFLDQYVKSTISVNVVKYSCNFSIYINKDYFYNITITFGLKTHKLICVYYSKENPDECYKVFYMSDVSWEKFMKSFFNIPEKKQEKAEEKQEKNIKIYRNKTYFLAPIVYEKALNTYTKGNMFCVLFLDEDNNKKVHKYPLCSLFRVEEDYE